jgi:aminopeptidase N
MRHIYLLITVAALLVGCASQHNNDSSTIYDSGVSRELADWRKATIADLRYNLHFEIPAERSSEVVANVEILFRLDTPQEIVIDFRDLQGIKSVCNNVGEIIEYTAENEHIIIPESYTQIGENSINIEFIAGSQSLNRNDEFLYTLLVPDRARTLFPCFDQPNLKASFTLSLAIPEEWCAVSNTAVSSSEFMDNGRKVLTFAPTEPLSTYLFSFVAGRLESQRYDDGKHQFTAYYRESDPKRLAQLPTIFEQVAASIEWLEEYTTIEYPFAKYDFIILPGFQYGGMEHTGATLYNDTQMFLSEHPTPDEELRRIELIAHETAHMWFGDYVTMEWFDDVWTKEVFANYFAARITEPLFPNINHRLNFMKNYAGRSLAEDNTLGTTSIRQPLDNLQNAGLIYGNIIYNKAPVVMEKMVEIMGEDAFREGIREYLHTYAYGNATYGDLIAILDKRCDADLKSYNEAWVNQKGMPHIYFNIEDDTLVIRQVDIFNRGLTWQQSFACTAIDTTNNQTTIDITLTEAEHRLPLPEGTRYLIANTDGRGYGLFIMDEASNEWCRHNITTIEDDVTREALIMNMHECYEAGLLDDNIWLNTLVKAVSAERNALIASTICSFLYEPMRMTADPAVELQLLHLSQSHPLVSCRQQLLRLLSRSAMSSEVTDALLAIWQEATHPLLNVNDYMTLAYEMSLRYPSRYEHIATTQRERLTDGDRRRQFDYIIRFVTPDSAEQERLFNELLEPENRRTEPWAARALGYLNHPLREQAAVAYIRRGLDELLEVQRTGDIFFPRNWVAALLADHRSIEAYNEVVRFLDENPDYPQLMKNKILQAAHPLYREHSEQR